MKAVRILYGVAPGDAAGALADLERLGVPARAAKHPAWFSSRPATVG